MQNFATIYVLSCGEILTPKVHLWRKNHKYEVCVLGAIGPENIWLLTYFVINLKAKILEVCDAQEEKRPRRKDALVPYQP